MFAEDATDVRVLVLAQYEAPSIEEAMLRRIRGHVRANYRAEMKILKEFADKADSESKREMYLQSIAEFERVWRALKLDLEDNAAEAKYCAEMVARRRSSTAADQVTLSSESATEEKAENGKRR